MESNALVMFNQTIRFENEMIWIKPVCDFFNLHVQNQYLKIKNDPILGAIYRKNHKQMGEIDSHGRIFLTKKGFIRWIQIINPRTVHEDLRQKFHTYQELVFDYLVGSAEEQRTIGLLNAKLHELGHEYSQTGNEIRRTKKALFTMIDQRFGFALSEKQQSA